jgi:hypothetical protein
VSVSGDGKYQTAVGEGGHIYTSINYGVTWSSKGTNTNLLFQGVSMTENGDIQTAVAYTENIYISKPLYNLNGGVTISNVGINTTSPLYALDVYSYVPVGYNQGYRYGWAGGATNSSEIGNICSRFNDDVWVTGTFFSTQTSTSSDQRIKDNIEVIDDNQSLQKFRVIEPKKYEYIDKQKRGSQTVFGFIAQEVRAQFPEATKLITDYIPNILSLYMFTYIEDSIILIENIQNYVDINENVKLIDYLSNEIISTVIYKQDNQVHLKLESMINNVGAPESNKIFVYGKEVSDFHTLNKDYLFTINFAATQELDRMIDWHTKEVDRSVSGDAGSVYGQSLLTKIKTLEQEKSALQTQVTTLDTQVTTLQTQLQSILTRLQNANL